MSSQYESESAGIPVIDYEAALTVEDHAILLQYGWELSEDERTARLYSEEWSSVQAAVFSTKWWIGNCLAGDQKP